MSCVLSSQQEQARPSGNDCAQEGGSRYRTKVNSSLPSKMLPIFLLTRVGCREMLSKTDCMKINSLYGCFNDPAVNRKIQIICAMVGIWFLRIGSYSKLNRKIKIVCAMVGIWLLNWMIYVPFVILASSIILTVAKTLWISINLYLPNLTGFSKVPDWEQFVRGL